MRFDAFLVSKGGRGGWEYVDPSRGLIFSLLQSCLFHEHLLRKVEKKNPDELKEIAHVLRDVAKRYLDVSERCQARWLEKERSFVNRRAADLDVRQGVTERIQRDLLGEIEAGRLYGTPTPTVDRLRERQAFHDDPSPARQKKPRRQRE